MKTKKPIHKIKDRRLSAAIWANKTKDGKTVHSVTFTRVYRQGEEFRDSTSFGRFDLLAIARLAQDAYAFLSQQERTNS